MVVSAFNRLSGQNRHRFLQRRVRGIIPDVRSGERGCGPSSALTFRSHVRAVPLSVPLPLHLGLHLGNHLLHPSQLCSAEQQTGQGKWAHKQGSEANNTTLNAEKN